MTCGKDGQDKEESKLLCLCSALLSTLHLYIGSVHNFDLVLLNSNCLPKSNIYNEVQVKCESLTEDWQPWHKWGSLLLSELLLFYWFTPVWIEGYRTPNHSLTSLVMTETNTLTTKYANKKKMLN